MFHPQARQTATGENPVKSPSAPSQVPAILRSESALSIPGRAYVDDNMYAYIDTPSAPPSIMQLAALRAVPAGMLASMRGARRHQRSARARLAREGQIVSKLFDNRASRPQPTNGVSLEQSIQMELTLAIPGITSSSGTSGVTVVGGRAFTVADFTGSAALLGVFDQYKIDQIECWLENQNPNANANTPELYSAVDLDDANAPAGLQAIQDHQGAIVSGGYAGHYHKFAPHVAVAVYSGAFTSFSNSPSAWIDSASPNVQHYGLKFATVSTGAAQQFNLVVRAVVSFRAPAIN
jgi:hypothetical protein